MSLVPSYVAFVYVRDTTEKPLRLVGSWPSPKVAGAALQEILLRAKAEGFLYPNDFDPAVGLRFVPYHAIDEACIEEEPLPTLAKKVGKVA